jgi:RNA polymerase sigma-70 factor (ECF subfamily)
VALNLARDVLRRRKRRTYIGPWLPSPIETDPGLCAAAVVNQTALPVEGSGILGEPPSHEPVTFEGRYDLIESVSFAFLLAVEALTPAQRAVLILCDVFDYTVKETAAALDMSEANVNTTHHRARRALRDYDAHSRLPTSAQPEATRNALATFLRSLEAHDVPAVEALLARDVKLTTDGGGEFTAALRTVVGREKVARFFLKATNRTSTARVRFTALNYAAGIVTDVPAPADRQAPRFTLSVELNGEEQISHIYVVSASQKLSALSKT